MMRSLKIRGRLKSASHHNKEEQRHAEKIKSIKQVIATDFKNFYQGVFYGLSK
ncbi:hypothetical protein HpMMM94_08030 [Helicobacter pylori]